VWFDTHAHLSDPQFDSDRTEVVKQAHARGVTALVEIADGPVEWEKARQLSAQHPRMIWWAAGLHPYYADQASPAIWQRLKELTSQPQFVAIGEVGLDYAKATIPPDVQKKAFREALELAQSVRKPLIIHCRNAYHDLHPILAEFPTIRGVVHCFSGTQEDAEKVLAKGLYVGVDGPLTYPSAKDLREVMSRLPLERILLETDAPYLPPQTHRGKRNEPAHVVAVGEKLAEIRGLTPELVASTTFSNAIALFGLNPTVFSA
jgi:TatD DNase family protein